MSPLLEYMVGVIVRKMEKRERVEMECEAVWEKISVISKEVTEIEDTIKQQQKKEKSPKKQNEERKDVLHLKRKLVDLENQRQEVRKELETVVKNYMDQQSQILTRKWIKKQKKRLLKWRSKETAEIKANKDRCERLLTDCRTLLEKFSKLKTDKTDPNLLIGFPGKEKKKKKPKKDILIGALKLEGLREQFEYFCISPPDNEEDLELAIPQLEEKLREVLCTPLTEVAGVEEGEAELSNLSATFEQCAVLLHPFILIITVPISSQILVGFWGFGAVSYTHLTLPTNREV
eukprot:TRINITY_DN3292_c0_g1_i5.p1 TRINITY_DN3292_c0_g1~~TRINITY_DN3292_c0_g1_i5.p1  ORF type:complete len:290 (-),score=83.46 TRINITY_DN3292_c0_g1_i5:47-916(-)